MTENKSQESCTSKAKSFWSNFYDSPCFWLKIISLTIILGLAIFGLYKIVASAFHYFNEPLSYFDPERLGQLGDFLGGTLNPIFGFATVCLLLWSVFIQRKELSLTREELKASAVALTEQVKLATDAYNRKQLDEILQLKNIEYEQCITKSFEEISITSQDPSIYPSEEIVSTIEQLINTQKRTDNIVNRSLLPIIGNIVKNIITERQSTPGKLNRQHTFLNFRKITIEIFNIYFELLKITKIISIQDNIELEALAKIGNARLIHIIDTDEANKMSQELKILKSTLRTRQS